MRAVLLAALLVATNLVTLAQTEAPKPKYDFGLPREERIKLAESAAPPEISGKATVYVLERTGYAKVREGTNGFTCFVHRQAPVNLEPTCFDAEGSATQTLGLQAGWTPLRKRLILRFLGNDLGISQRLENGRIQKRFDLVHRNN
jgi:hypothetical protein